MEELKCVHSQMAQDPQPASLTAPALAPTNAAWHSTRHIKAKQAHSRFTQNTTCRRALPHNYPPYPQRLDALTRFTHSLMRAR